ncbi:hypothetical protein EMPS_01142 [Entomortierella parvispora]|uniref:Uncharacterized protein n=1 Tax=Entomortierella parvispora TaxID=205924 RepID=A0A9P3H295_9FUNG|nr:hypothetical protein EMPS_01142 [Entomortierella parvispora]
MHLSTPILLVLACVASAMAASRQITVTDKGFEPAQVCINSGDSVNWYFAAGGHSVQETVAPGSCDSKNTWRSAVMQPGWRWSRTFKTTGVISYSSSVGNDCANGFKGTIYVGVSCPTTNEVPKETSEERARPETPAISTASKNPSGAVDTIAEDVKAKTNSAATKQASMALAAIAVAIAAAISV